MHLTILHVLLLFPSGYVEVVSESRRGWGGMGAVPNQITAKWAVTASFIQIVSEPQA